MPGTVLGILHITVFRYHPIQFRVLRGRCHSQASCTDEAVEGFVTYPKLTYLTRGGKPTLELAILVPERKLLTTTLYRLLGVPVSALGARQIASREKEGRMKGKEERKKQQIFTECSYHVSEAPSS